MSDVVDKIGEVLHCGSELHVQFASRQLGEGLGNLTQNCVDFPAFSVRVPECRGVTLLDRISPASSSGAACLIRVELTPDSSAKKMQNFIAASTHCKYPREKAAILLSTCR